MNLAQKYSMFIHEAEDEPFMGSPLFENPKSPIIRGFCIDWDSFTRKATFVCFKPIDITNITVISSEPFCDWTKEFHKMAPFIKNNETALNTWKTVLATTMKYVTII